jgi:lysyl-tRNA synthetase class 1
VYFEEEEEIKGMKDLEETYELSQPYDIPGEIPFQLPYRHLVTLVQIGENWKDVKQILQRTGQIPKGLNKKDEGHLKQRSEHAEYWLENFAPDMVKFQVKKQLPKLKLEKEQKKFLEDFLEKLPKISWEPEDIHKGIYDISEKEKIPIKTAFTTIYQIILGQEKGPRAGFFLSNLDKDFVIKRVKEAVK